MENAIPGYSIENLRSVETDSRDFDFFRFEYFARDIEHLKAPHRHHFYTFILVTSGGGSHAIDFKNFELKPARLFLIAPSQIHAWNQLDNVKGFVVFFTDSFSALAKGRKLISDWPVFKPRQKNYFDLNETELKFWLQEFERIEKEFTGKDEFRMQALFYSIGNLLVRASRLQKGSKFGLNVGSDFLFQFQELIEQNFITAKLPKQYAEMMNVTPNYLNTLCKKVSGKSAGELIRQRVLLESKRLLAHTNSTAAEIAFQLGFEDNSYFGRFFTKYTGVTPAAFRESQKK